MIEAVINATFTLALLTFMLMLVTAPGWIVGQVLAHTDRALPVPFFLRSRIVRWVLWYLTGTAALIALVLAARPIGALDTWVRLALVACSLGALAIATAIAFYVGWTNAAKRLARRGDRASAPPAMAQVYPSWQPGAQAPAAGSTVVDSTGEYAPARPHEDDEYRPATPHQD